MDVANFTKMVKDYETRLRDHNFVRSSEHTVCHAKFAAVDALKEWVKKNPSGLSYFCYLTSSDSPAPTPSFASFCDS